MQPHSILRKIKRCLSRRFLSAAGRILRYEAYLNNLDPVETQFGFQMLQPPHVRHAPGHFDSELYFFREQVAQIDVMVDIGANVGIYSAIAASLQKTVIAVEPLRSNLCVLFRNFQINSFQNVEVWPVALSSRPQIQTIFGAGTGASLLKGWANSTDKVGETVAGLTLDILMEGRFRGLRTLIKVDVEGAEHDVLRGASQTLGRSPRPMWWMEICLTENQANRINPHFVETFELFWRRGYSAYAIDPSPRAVNPSDVERWVRNSVRDFGSQNFLFR